MHRLFALIVLFPLVGPISSTAQEEMLLHPRATGQGVVLTKVADQLAFPIGMTPLPDGSLLVATSPSATGNFFASTGELVRLFDTDGDGSLDDRRTLAGDLPGSLVAVARSGNLVIATSAQGGNEQIMFFRRGERWRDPLIPVETIRLHFQGALHQSYALATRPNPDDAAAFDLVFNIGAAGYDAGGSDVGFDGIISGTLAPSSLYLMTVIVNGDRIDFGEPIQIATGLRNASALAFHPESGDLWIGENGIDGLDNPIVAFSADELNVIPAARIGTEMVDFGFAEAYINYASGDVIGDESHAVAFRPIAGSEAEGIAGIVFVPGSFPADLAGGILAGFHGQFDLTGIANEENPVRWVNVETSEQFHLISNDSVAIGHLDSMTATDDAIYIADFCNASMTSSEACGVIYRLTTEQSANAPG